jgi:hypothetical protein
MACQWGVGPTGFSCFGWKGMLWPPMEYGCMVCCCLVGGMSMPVESKLAGRFRLPPSSGMGSSSGRDRLKEGTIRSLEGL